MTTTKIKASEIKVGDVVMPPDRELSLWMRRHIAEKGLSANALHLTVAAIDRSADKRGEWIHIKGEYNAEWKSTNADPSRPSYMSFKTLAGKAWPVVK